MKAPSVLGTLRIKDGISQHTHTDTHAQVHTHMHTGIHIHAYTQVHTCTRNSICHVVNGQYILTMLFHEVFPSLFTRFPGAEHFRLSVYSCSCYLFLRIPPLLSTLSSLTITLFFSCYHFSFPKRIFLPRIVLSFLCKWGWEWQGEERGESDGDTEGRRKENQESTHISMFFSFESSSFPIPIYKS